MSDLKRYEEELAKRLRELSSTNKDLVWQKIENLLDKDEDTGGAFFLWNYRKFFLLAGLLFISVSILWFKFSPSSNNLTAIDNKEPVLKNTTKKAIIEAGKKDTTAIGINNKIKDNTPLLNEKGDTSGLNSDKLISTVNDNLSEVHKKKVIGKAHLKIIAIQALAFSTDNPMQKGKKGADVFVLKNNKGISFASNEKGNLHKAHKKKITGRARLKIIATQGIAFNNENPNAVNDNADELINPEKKENDSSKNDFSKTEIVASIADSDAVKTNRGIIVDKGEAKDTVKIKNKKTAQWAAGLAVQQSANLDCHCLYTNSAYTANPKVLDYLPSVYLRYYHKQKWFLQAEFKYAPQYINAFTYKINVQKEPFGDIVTAYTLKKVYSNQLAVSYHYFILPNLSIGTGIIYNLFSGAEIQKDVYRKQYESAKDAFLGSININNTSDSGFNNHMYNDFQYFLEAQYKWNHVSFGLNYAIGLTPYAKYIDPYSGQPVERNKRTLNIFIRYELWKSKSNK